MAEHRIFKARFSDIYPLYVQKALRKGRTQDEVDAVILWLTGYTPGGLARQLAQRTDMASFFGQAPRFNPAGAEIKGVVCGMRLTQKDAHSHPLSLKLDKHPPVPRQVGTGV